MGDWKEGHYDGKGSMSYRHGERYEGFFKQGVRFGEGRYGDGAVLRIRSVDQSASQT